MIGSFVLLGSICLALLNSLFFGAKSRFGKLLVRFINFITILGIWFTGINLISIGEILSTMLGVMLFNFVLSTNSNRETRVTSFIYGVLTVVSALFIGFGVRRVIFGVLTATF